MNEKDVKFFRPLWIRVGVTAALAAWFSAEAMFTHDQLWMAAAAVGIAYCIWNFFLRFPPNLPRDSTAPVPADSAAAGEPPKQP